MRILRTVAVLFGLAFAGGVYAACPSPPYPTTDACLQWTAPTKNTDGTPITRPLSYRVYRDGVAVLTTTALFANMPAQPSGQRCYYVTAITDGVESAPSGTGCKMIRPAAPTQGSIEAPTEGSFEP